MLKVKAKIRKSIGRNVKSLRKTGSLPAILYGPEIKNQSIEIDANEFNEVYQKAGESSLIELAIEGAKKKNLVLIYDIQTDPLSGKPDHIDFYQPLLTEEVEVMVPLVFEGDSLAVKDLGGTLVHEIQEIEISALPEDLPHEIRVDIGVLKTFEDEISVKDLKLPKGVKIKRSQDDIVATVVPPTKVEEELAKPVEEKVEEVEKVEKEKKEGEEVGEATEEKSAKPGPVPAVPQQKK